jgi:hypothetical protein
VVMALAWFLSFTWWSSPSMSPMQRDADWTRRAAAAVACGPMEAEEEAMDRLCAISPSWSSSFAAPSLLAAAAPGAPSIKSLGGTPVLF